MSVALQISPMIPGKNGVLRSIYFEKSLYKNVNYTIYDYKGVNLFKRTKFEKYDLVATQKTSTSFFSLLYLIMIPTYI